MPGLKEARPRSRASWGTRLRPWLGADKALRRINGQLAWGLPMLVAIGVHSSSGREQRPGCARHAVERGSAGAGQTAANAAPLLSGRERAGALPSRAPDLRASIVEACNGSVVLIQWTLLFNALAHQPTAVPSCILASHQLHHPRVQLRARRRAEIAGQNECCCGGRRGRVRR